MPIIQEEKWIKDYEINYFDLTLCLIHSGTASKSL